MPEISTAEVISLARALALPLTPDDLVEVTHRVNAFLIALAALADLPLDAVDPAPPDVPSS